MHRTAQKAASNARNALQKAIRAKRFCVTVSRLEGDTITTDMFRGDFPGEDLNVVLGHIEEQMASLGQRRKKK
jgi:hypothetical protein